MPAIYHPCPDCGHVPRIDGQGRPMSADRHCEDSKTCNWARCPMCKTVWLPLTGASYRDAS